MKETNITKQQARRFLLAHQRLLPPYQYEGKQGVLDFIRHVGCIQFDPLDIVGHNSELVLQSRVSGFSPGMLQELLYRDRKLVDGWDKKMSIYCTEDWPHFIYRQREAAKRSERRDIEVVRAVYPEVRKAIEERGPLSSIDLDHDRKVAWSWGPTRLAKVALDDLYNLGELVIHSRIHTRKVYDLASRHLPEEILNATDPHETQEEYHDWHVLRRIGGAGLVWNKGILWPGIYGVRREERTTVLKRLIKQGKALEVHVEGARLPLYMRSQDMTELDEVTDNDIPLLKAALLAPLDNLLWERELIRDLFGFDYTWEVYKPVAERKYGYYVLPVLYGDRFIARFEPGCEKDGALVIKNWWWEPDVTPSEEMSAALKDCFKQFLKYLGTETLIIDKVLKKREGLDWLLRG